MKREHMITEIIFACVLVLACFVYEYWEFLFIPPKQEISLQEISLQEKAEQRDLIFNSLYDSSQGALIIDLEPSEELLQQSSIDYDIRQGQQTP